MTVPAAVAATALPLERVAQGKVRDIYAVDAAHLLLVTTDRISAFDVVMREPIPGKGIVLTQVTAWWLRTLGELVPNHLVSADTDEIVRQVPSLAAHRGTIAGRIFPVECVIRGYLSGSMWKEYAAHGTMAGEPVAAGLRESDRFPTPLFTPATKAETGHDENITIPRMREIVGDATAAELERLTRLVYEAGSAHARERGIIIADTKFEFGECDGRILLCDEVLTPDSSRFWPGDD
ncbi:MAG: phosphoribosylaminoimidazolesuccinocarboxamide synthase, partial [Gemmatimonadaceae bacterium]|nr:phosphoribosylaminoimidazolesuccinocarboxamide synthase [Gemmatimonadaceae bacterium]